MLGFDISESTVARYMLRTRRAPSQGWKTFLRNHAAGVASVDLIVVRTISFKLLYGLVMLHHARRRLVRIAVTTNPTAEWVAGQVTEAFPWNEAPKYLIRDRDGAFGPAYVSRVRAMGIRDRPIAARSPWQNGHVERLIGSIRRECLDHIRPSPFRSSPDAQPTPPVPQTLIHSARKLGPCTNPPLGSNP